MRRTSAAAAAVAALAALSGCQSESSDRAVSAVRGFLAAVERGDGAGACERLSEKGLSELLQIALEADVRAPAPSAARPCAAIAGRLPSRPAATLRAAPVEEVVLHERTALVDTAAGSFEAEEREGRWELSGLEGLAEAVRGEEGDDVTLLVVRPRFRRPALGATRAHVTGDDEVDVLGVVTPPGARVEARAEDGGPVARVEAAGDRFRLRLRVRRGDNVFRLRGSAAGHRSSELVLRVRRR